MEIRSIPAKTLSLIDDGAFDCLLPLVRNALWNNPSVSIDLQVEQIGPEFFLSVVVLQGDLIVSERDLALGALEGHREIVRVAILWLWSGTLAERARRTRDRALRGIREIEEQERRRGG